jgi:hypothetical protein
MASKEQVKESTKNNKGVWIVLVLLIAIIAIVAIVLINNSQSPSINPNVVKDVSNAGTGTNCKEVQEPYDYLEEYQETVPYTTQKCETKDLPYSVTNFVEKSNICNQEKQDCKTGFMGIPYDCVSYCVDKTISCSLDLNNLDTEESGTWSIRFNFVERGTNNVIKYQDTSYQLYPQTTRSVPGAVRIQSSGKEGDANKNIGCSYAVSSVPTKQVCRDVTDYKEVTKTRTVIRYRNVQKCT